MFLEYNFSVYSERKQINFYLKISFSCSARKIGKIKSDRTRRTSLLDSEKVHSAAIKDSNIIASAVSQMPKTPTTDTTTSSAINE